jgi:hypothetical protein
LVDGLAGDPEQVRPVGESADERERAPRGEDHRRLRQSGLPPEGLCKDFGVRIVTTEECLG